jgi:hypothetical protein
MKSAILASAALAITVIGLSGCGEQASDGTEAAPDAKPDITVTDGRLILPAVKGNPGAVYFNITYDGDETAVLRAASVQGAKSAMIHETFETDGEMSMGDALPTNLKKGDTVKFEPGGKHVMAMDLDDALAPGATTEVTLTFLGGDKMTFPATILAAGDAR